MGAQSQASLRARSRCPRTGRASPALSTICGAWQRRRWTLAFGDLSSTRAAPSQGGAVATQLTTALAPGRWPTGPALRSLSITATCTQRAMERVDDQRADRRLDISPLTSRRSFNWNQDSDCQQKEYLTPRNMFVTASC